ncbi:hypothetical protein B0H16DRAFT_1453153 [Mycena metata]|uniref:Uncharacterized protein n=1 Tax=Mycena metata TaxID=1033252 RepID=A0AAD7JNA2_9AGAR|nr:hypothetical protein B0H16DRAFT_1453153 [Mycena metata]
MAGEEASDEVCTMCNHAFLTQPTMAVGHYTLKNNGRYYQRYMADDYSTDAPCHNFFCDEVQRAFAAREAAQQSYSSVGVSLSSVSPSSSFIAHSSISPDLNTASTVFVPIPSVAIWPTSIACSFFASAPAHNMAATIPVNSFTLKPYSSISSTSAVPYNPPSTPVTPVKAYACPTDPLYAHKLVIGDFAVPSTENRLPAYKKARTHILEVHW